MKLSGILLLCSAAALPQLVIAADLSGTDPAGLGQMHALLDFCSQAIPQNSASFRAEWQSIVEGQGSLLAQIEQNAAYKQQYTELTNELQKLPKAEMQTLCAASAALWNGYVVRNGGNQGKDGKQGKDDQGPKPSKGSDREHKPGQDR